MFLFRALALLSGWVVSSISPSFHFVCFIFVLFYLCFYLFSYYYYFDFVFVFVFVFVYFVFSLPMLFCC